MIEKKKLFGNETYVCSECGGLCGTCKKCKGPLIMACWEPITLKCLNCGEIWQN